MTWGYIAVAAGTVVSGYMSSEASKDAAKKQGKGADAAIAENARQYDQARTDLAPYRETGGQALNALASGLGLEGYYPSDKPLTFNEWARTNGYAVPGAAGGKSGGGNGLMEITGTGDAIDTIKGLFGKKKKPKATGPTLADLQGQYQQYVQGYQAPEHGASSVPAGDFVRDFTLDDFQKDPGYQFRMDEGIKAVDRSASARGGVFSGRAGKELERFGQDYASGEYSNAYNRFNNDRTQRFNRLATLAGVGQTATNTTVGAGANSSANIADLIVGKANAAAAGRVGQANAVNEGVQTLGNLYLQRQFGTGRTTRPQPQATTYPSGGWS